MNETHIASIVRPNDATETDAYKRIVWLIAILLLIAITVSVGLVSHWGVHGISEHIVLTLHGSTSLGDELVPKLATAFLRDELGATETGVRIASTDTKGHRSLRVWGKVPGRTGLQVIEIHTAGSGEAFDCLAAKGGNEACDIGMSSRPINDLDKRRYPSLRNLDDRATEHVVALDGIAIIINPRNPIAQLSVPQLRDIYMGRIANWKNVGGNDAPIELYGRDSSSGTYEMFMEKVLRKDSLSSGASSAVRPDHQIGDSGMIVDAVLRSPDAIGYVSSPMIRSAKAVPISDGSGPALRPTELSIVTEDYPICRRLLLYDSDVPGSLMNAFVRYVVYKPGQTLVAQTPFVELTPKVFRVTPPLNSPLAYREVASKYSRIGLSFHFSSDQAKAFTDPKNQLDNLARVNILRLRTFLAQHGGTGDDILLLGFADGQEGSNPNQQIGYKRAENVATSLRGIGVIVPSQNIRDFGASLPVATNEGPEGRRKNRRVEVWVRDGLR